MTDSTLGLYALKPWYADRLVGVRTLLVARRVSPTVVTAAGVGFGAAAGAALALTPAGPVAGGLVGALLAIRLAAANLDGALARDTGRCTPRGALANELGDRLAELAALAGCLAVAPWAVVAVAAFAATLPSWVALAGAAAGAPRINGGPVGKTERCTLLTLAALTGAVGPVLWTIAAGSALTALWRGCQLMQRLAGAR